MAPAVVSVLGPGARARWVAVGPRGPGPLPRDRRRLWPAGWPAEHLVAGLPDGDSYAVGTNGHAGRGGKNTVPAGPGRR